MLDKQVLSIFPYKLRTIDSSPFDRVTSFYKQWGIESVYTVVNQDFPFKILKNYLH